MPRPTTLLERLYVASLLLLPRWLRRRVADDMLATVRARLAAAPARSARYRAFAHELLGVAHTAVASRLHRPLLHPAAAATRSRSQLVDALRQDVRFAGRALRRERSVALLAIVTLALGVGTSSAMFSVVDAVLLRPLPFERPERIVFVNPTIEEWRGHPSLHENWQRGRFSAFELRTWLEQQRSFESAAGYSLGTTRIRADAGSELVPTASVTSGFFTVLRTRSQLGRLPGPQETEPVAVLTHAFWQSRHGGDPAIIGGEIRLGDQLVRVIGVLPPDFSVVGMSADIWRPLDVSKATPESINNHFLSAIGRLHADVSFEQAAHETTQLLRGVTAELPNHITHGTHLVRPVDEATRKVRGPLLVLAAASVLLLVAACANVALLLLGAGADRLRELAVRQALGARKSRLATQLFVESTLLAAVGAAAGILVATASIKLLVWLAPAGIPRLDTVALDLRTVGLAMLLAVATGIGVGCFPALSLTRVEAAGALRAGTMALGRGRLQRGIVVAQLAVATVLLVGAGLLTRTMQELQRVEPGFETEQLFSVQLSIPWDRFWRPGVPSSEVRPQLASYFASLTDAVTSIPGVHGAAWSTHMPFSDDRQTNPVEPEGYVPAEGEVIDAARRVVSGNYFEVMGVAPLQGRVLTAADDSPSAPRVMVVSDRFARHFWPDGRWLDRTVGFWGNEYRVVGIVADAREQDLRGDADYLKFYVAQEREGNSRGDNLLFRTTIPPMQLLPLLRERLFAVDPALVISDAMPMTERIAASLAADRYRTRLMLAFSATAFFFSLLGTYGVMSRAVVRRRREIGVRMALGAQRTRIVRLVLGEAAGIGAAGAACGVGMALVASRALESLLWGVPRLDAVTYAGAALLLLALTLVASAIPARRAASVEPMGVIRD